MIDVEKEAKRIKDKYGVEELIDDKQMIERILNFKSSHNIPDSPKKTKIYKALDYLLKSDGTFSVLLDRGMHHIKKSKKDAMNWCPNVITTITKIRNSLTNVGAMTKKEGKLLSKKNKATNQLKHKLNEKKSLEHNIESKTKLYEQNHSEKTKSSIESLQVQLDRVNTLIEENESEVKSFEIELECIKILKMSDISEMKKFILEDKKDFLNRCFTVTLFILITDARDLKHIFNDKEHINGVKKVMYQTSMRTLFGAIERLEHKSPPVYEMLKTYIPNIIPTEEEMITRFNGFINNDFSIVNDFTQLFEYPITLYRLYEYIKLIGGVKAFITDPECTKFLFGFSSVVAGFVNRFGHWTDNTGLYWFLGVLVVAAVVSVCAYYRDDIKDFVKRYQKNDKNNNNRQQRA